MIVRINDEFRPLRPLLVPMIAALTLSGCGSSEAPEPTRQEAAEPSSSALRFPLGEENESGRTGEAFVQPGEDGGLRVLLKLSDGSGESNPAHIHDVTCEQYRRMNSFNDQLATVENTLETLHGGQSDSTLSGMSMSERTTGTYSVNIHEPAEPYEVVACGDIPRR